jgi:hypothetical protein
MSVITTRLARLALAVSIVLGVVQPSLASAPPPRKLSLGDKRPRDL